MKKIFNLAKVVLVVLALSTLQPLELKAQLSQYGLVSSSSQQMIEDALKGSIFIVEQQYQLQDTTSGGYFGRGGRQEFGTTVSLGVKVQGGYLYLDPAERPWEYDGNFERYRQSHRPVLYKTLFRELTDSLGTEVASFRTHQSRALIPDRFYHAVDPTPFEGAGLRIDGTAGTKKGWLIWVTSAGLEAPEAHVVDPVDYVIYSKTLTLEADTLIYNPGRPSTQQKVWGGIYVIPVRTALGQLSFELVGVMVKTDDGWALLALTGAGQPADPAGGDQGNPGGGPDAAPSQEEDVLTPAGVDPAQAPADVDPATDPAPEEESDEQSGKKKKGKKKRD